MENKDRNIETVTFDWQGVPVSIEYEAHWLGRDANDKYSIAHLQVRSLSEGDKALPITETGYRSHFTNREIVAEHGGPDALVREWLDIEADTKSWKSHVAASRQLSLF